MRHLIRYRCPAQALKMLDLEKAEDYFEDLLNIREEKETEWPDDDFLSSMPNEADEIFDSLSGNYNPVDKEED